MSEVTLHPARQRESPCFRTTLHVCACLPAARKARSIALLLLQHYRTKGLHRNKKTRLVSDKRTLLHTCFTIMSLWSFQAHIERKPRFGCV